MLHTAGAKCTGDGVGIGEAATALELLARGDTRVSAIALEAVAGVVALLMRGTQVRALPRSRPLPADPYPAPALRTSDKLLRRRSPSLSGQTPRPTMPDVCKTGDPSLRR